jgi:putative transposase
MAPIRRRNNSGVLPGNRTICYESARREPGPTLIMRTNRHTPEPIIKKLRTASEELARGTSIEEVCRKLEISVATYHRLNKEYSGAKTEAVRRLKELEMENARLKKLVAEQALATTETPWARSE